MFMDSRKWKWQKHLSMLLVCMMVVGGFFSGFAATNVQAAEAETAITASADKTAYIANGDAVAIDPGLKLNYNENLDGATVVIDNFKAGDKLVFTNTTKITGVYTTNGILTLKGEATAAEYETALRSVTFSTTSNDATDRIIRFSLGSALPFTNGHFYEYVKVSSRIFWEDAKAAAEQRNFFGRQGYLVTITSQQENEFVKEKTQGLGWIGAQDIERKNGGSGDWRWVTGPEGLADNGQGLKFYKGYNGAGAGPVEGRYNNWQTGEPNNHGGTEYVAHIFGPVPVGTAGLWNDYSPTNTGVLGYVVEYGGMPNDSNIQISAAKTVVISHVNKTALGNEITTSSAAEQNNEDYTAESFEPFQTALKEAREVLANKNATQAEVDAALAKLQEARGNLVKREPRLENLNLSVADATYGNPGVVAGKQITPLSPEDFDGKKRLHYHATVNDSVYSVAIAPEAVNGGTVTVTLDDKVYTGSERNNIPLKIGPNVIKVTVDLGNDLTNTYTITITKVDKTALQAFVGGLDGLNKDIYTPESWGALQDAWDAAQALLDNNGLIQSQEAIDKALADLVAAKAALEIDKTILQERVNDSKTLTSSHYTPESWQQLQDALKEAQIVLDNPQATEEQVAKALDDLNEAYAKLQKKSPALTEIALTDPETGAGIDLSPAFGSNELNYTAVVPNETSAISLDPTALHPDSQVKLILNGKEVDPQDWNNLPLQEGLNVITVEVTDPKTGETKTYTFEIMRTTNKLTDLKPSYDRLSPAFDAGTDAYTMRVTNDVYQMTLTPTALDPEAKIEVSINGGPFVRVNSGEASEALQLNVGDNQAVVRVTDRKGVLKEYVVAIYREEEETASGGPGGPVSGGGGGIPSTPTAPGSLETTVNGAKEPFATGTTTSENGRTTTNVQVHPEQLKAILDEGNNEKLAIRVPGDGDVKVTGLTAEQLKRIADSGSALEVGGGLAIYPVPGSQIDFSGIANRLGNADLGDIDVQVNIKRSPEAVAEAAKAKAQAGGYELLVNPVDLELTFSHDGNTIQAGQLDGYATKYIALPDGIDLNRITTGVVVYPDGTIFHVPTVVTKINERYYAMINDLRDNGTYSVIWNPQNFADVRTHWGREGIDNIAARLSLAGTGNNTFSPDRDITRSEFASIVALGMGLMRQNAPDSGYPDVVKGNWNHDPVAIASEFGIVLGFEDGNFHGDLRITREQGIAMIARAYALVRPNEKVTETQAAQILAGFGDADEVSFWARDVVAGMIRAGIVEGQDGKLLNPQASMTRAETAALMQRLLQMTGLIDKK